MALTLFLYLSYTVSGNWLTNPSSVSLPYISVFSAGQSTGQSAGQSTGHGADPDASQSTDPDTGRGTGDSSLWLRRVLPSAWEPEVQKIREVQERPRDSGSGNPMGKS